MIPTQTKNTYQNNYLAALQYQKLGLSVIPVGTNKKPLIKWKEYQERIAEPAEIKQWFQNYPNAQVGIVTGSISQIIVVDVEESGNINNFPKTVSSRSGGGGWHFYFQYPDCPIKNSVKILRDLTDIRSDGGYIIAPPSLHSSGHWYEWYVLFDRSALAPLPEWVLERVKEQQHTSIPSINNINDIKNWEAFLEQTVSKGSRNMTATQLAGKLLYHLPKELWEVSGWQTMQIWNQQHNTPPLPNNDEGHMGQYQAERNAAMSKEKDSNS